MKRSAGGGAGQYGPRRIIDEAHILYGKSERQFVGTGSLNRCIGRQSTYLTYQPVCLLLTAIVEAQYPARLPNPRVPGPDLY